MSIFFKKQHKDNTKQDNGRQATLLSKAMTGIVTASLINVMALPAHAAAGQEKAKQAQLSQPVGDNSYEQIVNLTAKYQLEQDAYQSQREQQLSGRNIFQKMVDGVMTLFTDNSEVINQVDIDTLKHTQTQLLSLQEQLGSEQDNLNQELAQQAEQMKQAGFSEQDLAEHDKLTAELNERYHTLDKLFTTLANSNNDSDTLTAINAINKQLETWQPKTRQTDVENLPWGMPDNKVREPIVSEADAKEAFAHKINAQINHGNQLNQIPTKYSAIDDAEQSAIGEWRNTEYKFGQMLYDLNNSSNGFIKTNGLAGTTVKGGQWTVLNALPAEVQEADLKANEDVQITEAIKAKAKELEHNPAKIYKWVHDNIVYVPSYGSIQGSDYTLQTKRGNAFDTASLTIALLRASDIPARYVYGTVDIPAKQAMDWVGGVNNIDAAQNLLGQGGVPNTAIMDGSVPKYLRLEHVWVEANINFVSKGSVTNTNLNKAPNDSQNQWLPLDPSYKSYIRTEGIDLAKAVPFDAESLIKKAQEGATINEDTGSVQNLNIGAVNQAIEDYQAQVQAYLEQNHADATVGDMLGTTQIKEYKSTMLSPVLPYQVQTVVGDYQTLPDNMRHYFVINMYQDVYEHNNTMALGETPKVHVKIPTTQLQGKPLAMSFKPASKADEQKITNALPKPDENGDIDPSKIPTGFSNSLKMQAEITLDGKSLKAGNIYGFGSEVMTQIGFKNPKTGVNYTINTASGLSSKTIRAGEYHAIGYDMQGLSQQQLEKTKNTLETVKSKLEDYQKNNNQSVLDGITKHDITGAMLQATVQSYFAINDAQDIIAVRQNKNVVADRFMSYGTFHTFIKPNMRYGISFGGRMTGMQMDIDRLLRMGVAKDNDLAKLASFNQSQGARQSANEHLVPEQMFDSPDTDEKEVEGVSAIKAINIAVENGQTIYTITQDNYNEVLPLLNHNAQVMADIRNAVNSGKEVTTHQSTLSYGKWTGSGYIILDKMTGTGAYLIDGGANGAAFFLTVGLLIFSWLPYVFSVNPILGALLAIFATGLITTAVGVFSKSVLICTNGLDLVSFGISGLTTIIGGTWIKGLREAAKKLLSKLVKDKQKETVAAIFGTAILDLLYGNTVNAAKDKVCKF